MSANLNEKMVMARRKIIRWDCRHQSKGERLKKGFNCKHIPIICAFRKLIMAIPMFGTLKENSSVLNVTQFKVPFFLYHLQIFKIFKMFDKFSSSSSVLAPEVNSLMNWTMIIYAIVLIVLTLSGIFLNFAVIFITIRTKSFRGSVNILLAFYSLSEMLNLSGNFISVYTVFSGHYFMPFQMLYRLSLIPFIGASCAMILMFLTGVERLFIVLFPLKKFNQKLFLGIALTFNLIAIFVIVSSTKYFDQKTNSLEVFANYYEIGSLICKLEQSFILSLSGLSTVIISVSVYALIAVALQCQKVPSISNSTQLTNQRIFRSLFTIVAVNIGGYLIVFLNNLVIVPIFGNNLLAWHATQIGGILMHISASSNGPILYWRNLEYRKAFHKEFAFVLKIFCKRSSAVVPQ